MNTALILKAEEWRFALSQADGPRVNPAAAEAFVAAGWMPKVAGSAESPDAARLMDSPGSAELPGSPETAGSPEATELPGSLEPPEAEFAAESLIEKGLARREGGALRLDPVLRLVARAACSATEARTPFPGALALKCPEMYLLIAPYPFIPDALKIAPFQNEDALENAVREG
jgi:hypothetical protein